jgi:two-component system chemotaxis response regulator CheY
LAKVPILIADKDRELSRIAGGMLRAVGFSKIRYAHCSQAVVETVKEREVDIVLSEILLEPVDGFGILKTLRSAPDPAIKYLPMVMLSAKTTADTVLTARDLGANYFVAKPFSVTTVLARLRELIEQPRPFVVSPVFKGPDRRTKQTGVEINNRDTSPQRMRSIMSTKELAASSSPGAVKLIKPDYSLRRKIGLEVPLDQVFSPQALLAAQKAVDDSQVEFLSWLNRDCRSINETAQAILRGTLSMATGIGEVMDRSLTIKARAGTFGYDCASKIADSLHRYATEALLANHYEPVVLTKHTEALQTILSENIRGEGGSIGLALRDGLHRLCEKHLRRSNHDI